MEIIAVKTQIGVLEVGDEITVKYYNIVNDEEDKKNPVIKDIIIESFEPNDDGSLIAIKSKTESFYEDNIILKK
jgi:hypothetical protein